MPRYQLDLDKDKPVVPGKYFCTNCNKSQVILVKGQKLKPCPRCGGRSFSTV